MTSAVQFAAELDSFGSKIEVDALTLKRAVALQLLRGIVFGTPVGNPDLWQRPAPKGYVGGHARASWQVTHGAPAASGVAGTDASGTATLSAGSQAIAGADLERPTWITSNLPYIEPLEFEGHSSQAPEGWVLAHVERVKAQFP